MRLNDKIHDKKGCFKNVDIISDLRRVLEKLMLFRNPIT